MTARDVIAGLNEAKLVVIQHLDNATAIDLCRKINAAISILAQPSGEAVAWAVTDPAGFERPFTVDNADKAAHLRNIGYTLRPLIYGDTTPPAPLGGLTEGEVALVLAIMDSDAHDAALNRQYDDDAEFKAASSAYARSIVARRLTAPRAEGVDAETARMLVELVEGRECLRWASNSGVRLKDTPEWVAFYNATKAALTAAAPKVAADSDAQARIAQAFPALSAFYDKHALGPKATPSCLCCGKTTPPDRVAVGHMELPGIVVCVECKPAAAPQAEAGYMAVHEREQNWLADHMNPADPNFATIAARLATNAQPGGDGVEGYYLATFKGGSTGGEVLWWGPNNCGYSTDLEQAGIYLDPVKGYHDSEDTVPVPVSVIDRLRVRRVVDYGDSGNTALHSAKKLREWLAALAPQRSDNGDTK